MHKIADILISDEVWTMRFSCDYSQCKGVCCKLGDLGAPIDEDEEAGIKSLLPQLSHFLTKRHYSFLTTGITEIYKGSMHLREIEPNQPCPLSFFGENGIVLCSLHAYALENNLPPEKVKPLWCCLFPITLTKNSLGWIVNLYAQPHCRSISNAPPILSGYLSILKRFFGDNWIAELRRQYLAEGIKLPEDVS